MESAKCPARGISEGSRENPGSDDYAIIRESPARCQSGEAGRSGPGISPKRDSVYG